MDTFRKHFSLCLLKTHKQVPRWDDPTKFIVGQTITITMWILFIRTADLLEIWIRTTFTMSQHIWEVVAQIFQIKTRFKAVRIMKNQDDTYQLQETVKSLSKCWYKSFSLSLMFTRVLSKILIDSVLYVFA